MNYLLSVLLILGVLILGYPFIDELGLDSMHQILLGALVLVSVGALAWNFLKERINKVLATLVVIDLIVGLFQLYYFFTLNIY